MRQDHTLSRALDFNVDTTRLGCLNARRHFFRTSSHWPNAPQRTTLKSGGRGQEVTHKISGVIYFALTGVDVLMFYDKKVAHRARRWGRRPHGAVTDIGKQ